MFHFPCLESRSLSMNTGIRHIPDSCLLNKGTYFCLPRGSISIIYNKSNFLPQCQKLVDSNQFLQFNQIKPILAQWYLNKSIEFFSRSYFCSIVNPTTECDLFMYMTSFMLDRVFSLS